MNKKSDIAITPPRCPGLFITATDTGVGKTVVTCAIAAALRAQQMRVGVCKPFASDCDKQSGELISDDARAIKHFSQSPHDWSVIHPMRYAAPLAPAPAGELEQTPTDWKAIDNALALLSRESDALLVEGIGGIMVPLDPSDASCTVLDLAAALRLPVVLVTRASLGTLNHTAMSVQLLRACGCHVAGIIINYAGVEKDDASVASNRDWLVRMNDVKVLAEIPACAPSDVVPHEGRLPEVILQAMAQVHWSELAGSETGG